MSACIARNVKRRSAFSRQREAAKCLKVKMKMTMTTTLFNSKGLPQNFWAREVRFFCISWYREGFHLSYFRTVIFHPCLKLAIQKNQFRFRNSTVGGNVWFRRKRNNVSPDRLPTSLCSLPLHHFHLPCCMPEKGTMHTTPHFLIGCSVRLSWTLLAYQMQYRPWTTF